jgi:LPXTG-site transpeptidase (sortase) family protein
MNSPHGFAGLRSWRLITFTFFLFVPLASASALATASPTATSLLHGSDRASDPHAGNPAPPAAPGLPVYEWVPLGSGIDEWVYSLAIGVSGTVYAGHTIFEGDSMIHQWDGSDWSPLGSENLQVSGWAISSLAVNGTEKVYAGGMFSTYYHNNLALWDGRFWMSWGIHGWVDALAFDGSGSLCVGGEITQLGGVDVNNIAKLDYGNWSPLGSGVDDDVHTIAVDGSGNLYAGGEFHAAGGVSANHIAKWDGSAWSPLGSGVNGAVRALAIDGSGNVYAGGDFHTAGGVSVNHIAKWDGIAWSPLGSGVDDDVHALAVDGSGNVYAGGDFHTAGGVSVNNVARWTRAPEVDVDGVSSLPDSGDGRLEEGEVVAMDFSVLTLRFTDDMFDQPGGGGQDDITNVGNYSLVLDGTTPMTIDAVSYDNGGGSGPYLATLVFNGGVPLPVGDYTFRVKGTTSVVNAFGARLAGDGVTSGTDFVRTFSVHSSSVQSSLPDTGFAPGIASQLPAEHAGVVYSELGDLQLEIPSQGEEMTIIGVPQIGGGWDVTWLADQAGWLEGTSFPTLQGNSVLTAHVYLADGSPGPFVDLKELRWGDEVVIHAWGLEYRYQVRENRLILPTAVDAVMQHKDLDWVTLFTCETYLYADDEYAFRRMVQAVLVEVSANP